MNIRDLVEQTPFVDTHEHLIEERDRTEQRGLGGNLFPCDDWSYLFMHYLRDDLQSAGMSREEGRRFWDPETCTEEKCSLLLPYWERAKHTGYGQAVRHTLRGLYGLDDHTAQTAPFLAERYRELVRPGFYREILRERSNLECCQVNSLQRVFMETELPDLLPQDLSILHLSTPPALEQVERETGKSAASLDEWLEIVDWYFATYGPRAVAVKSQCAYGRRLDFGPATRAEAEPLFARLAQREQLSQDERKPLEDFLFRYCVGKAAERGLPVKLHTGYYAGTGYMTLERVRHNAADLCPLLQEFPDARFVLMHIGYPYQDEYIALAKHYRNVYIDMCWAWIINPLAGVRFLKEFLLAAPANKLFTFGGDYITVETVYGHSRIARLGITEALTELVAARWIVEPEVPELVDRIMRGNARELFPTRWEAGPRGVSASAPSSPANVH